MKRVLLDTHALLWWLFDDSRLSQRVREVLEDSDIDVYVSAASAWEIATKYRIGRLPVAEPLIQDLSGWLAKAGFLELPIRIEHARLAGTWPQEHKDPFDRLLAAQSVLEDLPLVSVDPQVKTFGANVIW